MPCSVDRPDQTIEDIVCLHLPTHRQTLTHIHTQTDIYPQTYTSRRQQRQCEADLRQDGATGGVCDGRACQRCEQVVHGVYDKHRYCRHKMMAVMVVVIVVAVIVIVVVIIMVVVVVVIVIMSVTATATAVVLTPLRSTIFSSSILISGE